MQFNVAALSEVALRLWLADFLPAEERRAGLAQFMRDMIEPSFPPTFKPRIDSAPPSKCPSDTPKM